MAHQAEAYPSFCSMKQLGIFLLPSGWDAGPLQGKRESKVSCPWTQHNVPGLGLNPDCSIWSQAHKPWGHYASQIIQKSYSEIMDSLHRYSFFLFRMEYLISISIFHIWSLSWLPDVAKFIPLFSSILIPTANWFLLTNATKHLMSLKCARLWHHGYDDNCSLA